MKEIKIILKDIPSGGLLIEDVFPKNDVGITGDDIIRMGADVKISAKAALMDKILLVEVHLDGLCSSECSRCLEDAHKPFHKDAHLDFAVESVDDVVDIAEDIRQEIVWDLPLRLLCREDCKGLCPACGKNLNEGPCEHQK